MNGLGRSKRFLVACASVAATVLAAAAVAQPVAASGPVVRTAAGSVEGVAVSGGVKFEGIPFAAPPVGPLRWAPPAPARPWQGVRKSALSAECMQGRASWYSDRLSEDCLYLNVWTPKAAASAKLPVMVWIHGGGYSEGSAIDPTFEGVRLIRHGVVLVSLNYRLGAFGYLAHRELSASSPNHVSGNYGLLDQIAALKWVRENIAAFGGDPGNVTIFGQSAGGGSVVALLASPMTEGLFRHAIVESGVSVGRLQSRSLADAEKTGERIADGASLARLREMSAQEIIKRSTEAQKGGALLLQPIIDGVVLREDPARFLTSRRRPNISLIIGNNAREAIGGGDGTLQQAVAREFGPVADKALALYEARQMDPAKGDGKAQFLTDTSFRCSAVIAQKRQAALGTPVWAYQYEQGLPGHESVGSVHSAELPYVFGTFGDKGYLAANYGDDDRALSELTIGYWTNFAKAGDPNGPGLPPWPRFEPSSQAYARFEKSFPGRVKIDHGLQGDTCELFERAVAAKGLLAQR